MFLQNGYPISLSHNIKVRHSPLFRRFLKDSLLDLPLHLPPSPVYSNFFFLLSSFNKSPFQMLKGSISFPLKPHHIVSHMIHCLLNPYLLEVLIMAPMQEESTFLVVISCQFLSQTSLTFLLLTASFNIVCAQSLSIKCRNKARLAWVIQEEPVSE